ncbi:Rha family transcriptional regulator [Ligilactobacillus equi]|uniref:Phage anti-repressor protein n=1 Tax=Ligilactobacillus equi DSM 15833 = JCM 10991 TaxID=1423740 RepID=A0A0R1TXC6_9LACO|nr:Rha family transcriptional regulator [Ligilactobacillus equi]KRL81771.1 phage anti-repressor protein [Ligilactobacillus equi DSM 15833 = JCM 10991]
MNDLVIMKDRQAVTTSLQVAEVFGKEHKNVIRAIEQKLGELNFEPSSKMFAEGAYTNSQNKKNKMYYLNRDGFTFIAFGFTGRQADEFKLKYIQAFNKMEELIKNQPRLPQTVDEKIYLLLQASHEGNQRIQKLETDFQTFKENQKLEPGEYSYIGQLVNKKVFGWIKVHKLGLSRQQRALLYKDINAGVAQVCGVRTRTQLREKDFETACEFIEEWTPSTATIIRIKQMGGVAEGQTELEVN